MVEPITFPFSVVVGLFTILGVISFISIWNYYGRKEAVKKLARSLKTDTEEIADRLAIEGEHLADRVEAKMKEFVRTEVKNTYKDIAHDISLLTLAVKDIARGSTIDSAKKDIIIMRLENEMRIMNKTNLNMVEDAKEDAVKIDDLKQEAKAVATEIKDLKEEAKVDTKSIERLETEKSSG